MACGVCHVCLSHCVKVIGFVAHKWNQHRPLPWPIDSFWLKVWSLLGWCLISELMSDILMPGGWRVACEFYLHSSGRIKLLCTNQIHKHKIPRHSQHTHTSTHTYTYTHGRQQKHTEVRCDRLICIFMHIHIYTIYAWQGPLASDCHSTLCPFLFHVAYK